MRNLWHIAFAGSIVVACGGSSTTIAGEGTDASTDGSSNDAATADVSSDGPTHTTTHDCAPACGSGRYCAFPYPGGFCPGPAGMDSGICPAGCPGCPPPPPPSCTALPAACNGTPSCDCLLTLCPCNHSGSCAVNADGDWVLGCLGC